MSGFCVSGYNFPVENNLCSYEANISQRTIEEKDPLDLFAKYQLLISEDRKDGSVCCCFARAYNVRVALTLSSRLEELQTGRVIRPLSIVEAEQLFERPQLLKDFLTIIDSCKVSAELDSLAQLMRQNVEVCKVSSES